MPSHTQETNKRETTQRRSAARSEVSPLPAPLRPAAQRGQCACGGVCPRCRTRGKLLNNAPISASGIEVAQAKLSNEPVPSLDASAPTQDDARAIPGGLRSNLETLSGFDLSHIRVHRNSSKPAQFDALAYTQGHEIFVAPGEERHLPHEAWHAVQQMQGRVQPTARWNGVSLNDQATLEREADTMGAKASQLPAAKPGGPGGNIAPLLRSPAYRSRPTLQRQPRADATTVTARATGNCSVANGNELGAAIVLAREWLRTAIQALHHYEALPLSQSSASTRAALQFHFHTINPFHAALIRTRLAQVRDGLDSAGGTPSDCAAAGDLGCGDATVAYHQHGRIFWCPYFFGRGTEREAKTIVHEYTHAEARRLPLTAGYAELSDSTPRRISDRAYLDRRYYLDLSPEEALDNADSFANLVADLGTGTPFTQSPSERAEDTMSGCAPGAQETIRQSLSMSARWNDAAIDMLSIDATSMPTWYSSVSGAITVNFGTSPPTRASLSAIYEAATTSLILGMSLVCDGARGNCQSPISRLWHEGMNGAIHVCPGWIAEGDALLRHRLLYQSVLSNVVHLPGNPWRYVDLARDLEARSDLDRPLPSLPTDPFPQSNQPGTAIG